MLNSLKIVKLSILYMQSADFFRQKLNFSINSFGDTIRVSNSLDPDQSGHYVRPDLGQTVCKGYQLTASE